MAGVGHHSPQAVYTASCISVICSSLAVSTSESAAVTAEGGNAEHMTVDILMSHVCPGTPQEALPLCDQSTA